MRTSWIWQGEVRFILEGSGLNGILSQAAQQGLHLRAVQRQSYTCITGRVSRRDAGRLRALAEEYDARLKRVHVVGLPYLWDSLRGRWGLIAGAVLCLFGLLWNSTHLRLIEYDGLPADDPARQAAQQLLEDAGLVYGATSQLNTQLLQNQVRSAVPELSFASVHIEGNQAQVMLVRQIKPPVREDTTGTALYASASGIVEQVTVLSGTALVSPGDAVSLGDPLISSEVAQGEGSRTTQARGSVMANIFISGEAQGPLPERMDTGRVCRRWGLSVGDWMLMMDYPSEEWPLFRSKTLRRVTFCMKPLDIHLVERLYYEQTVVSEDWDAFCEYMTQQATRQALQQLPEDAVILSRQSYTQADEQSLTAVTVFCVRTDIAKGEDAE